MKYLASLLFVAALAVAGVVSPAAGQSLDNGQAPQQGDPHSADLLARRPVSTPAPDAKSPTGKKVPLTASLAKDDKGKTPATTFAQADTVYVVWKDPSSAKGDKIRTAWYAVDTGKAFPKNKKLIEGTQLLPGPGAFGAAISPTIKGGLPPGKYRADVYENTKLDVSLPFTITK